MKEYKYKINGNIYKVAVGDIDDNIAQVEVNGVPYKVELERKAAPVKVVSAPKAAAAPRTSTGEKVIAKPSAGSKGNAVNAADTVLLLEAMKMENAIHAGRDGRIASINVNPGDSVLEGATLLTIE